MGMAARIATLDSSVQTIWTVGHSSRTWEEFLALLQAHRIDAIADVRRFAGSRKSRIDN